MASETFLQVATNGDILSYGYMNSSRAASFQVIPTCFHLELINAHEQSKRHINVLLADLNVGPATIYSARMVLRKKIIDF
jgi:hypothetical protein